jgi:hypothetical protein
MDPDVVKFAEVLAVIIVAAVPLAAAAALVKWLVRSQRAAAPPTRLDDDRLARLEQTVDAIAVEVERIAESQRFTTKLLVEHTSSEFPRRTT